MGLAISHGAGVGDDVGLGVGLRVREGLGGSGVGLTVRVAVGESVGDGGAGATVGQVASLRRSVGIELPPGT